MRASNSEHFQRFDFVPSYGVEIDPEFPADGSWGHAVYAFNRDGEIVETLSSNWGTPRVLLVTPSKAEPWVGLFPHGGLGGVSGVFAMPGSSSLCVSVGGLVFVLKVDHPEAGAVVESAAQQIVASGSHDLLLVSSFTDLTAFNSEGVAWQSARLVLDDLRVLSADGDTIRCSGTGLESLSHELIEIDAKTGSPNR
ncbi:hypothetical protein BH10ACT4_BH10ACT4_12460 [soil metagenome]